MEPNEQEKSDIRAGAARVEAQTGVQVLAVLADKSDTYPEIPWKAFSLGIALAALGLAAMVVMDTGRFAAEPLLWVTALLAAGLVPAAASIFLPAVARLFLSDLRAQAETVQFAQSLFLEHGLSRTRSRRAVLLMASCFERRSAVVADTGIAERVAQTDLDRICATMDARLAGGSPAAAMAAVLPDLERLLRQQGFAPSPGAGDEVAGEFLETKGPKS